MHSCSTSAFFLFSHAILCSIPTWKVFIREILINFFYNWRYEKISLKTMNHFIKSNMKFFSLTMKYILRMVPELNGYDSRRALLISKVVCRFIYNFARKIKQIFIKKWKILICTDRIFLLTFLNFFAQNDILG